MDGREIGQIIVHWNKVNRAFREGSAALIIGILAAVFGTFFLWLGLVQAIGAALIAFGVVVWGYRLLLIFRKKASNKRLSFAYNVYWLKGDDVRLKESLTAHSVMSWTANSCT